MGTDARANARRAMQELFGGRIETLNGAEEIEETEEILEPVAEEPVQEHASVWETMESAPKSVGTTVIDSDTVITGTIKSEGNVEVRGTVYGDIECAKDIHFYGRVAGNVNCSSFYHYTGVVKGDIAAAASVGVERSAAIKGNIKAKAVQVNGRLFGDISSTGSVDLLSSAVVAGNIETCSFNMKDTAKLQGAVKLLCDDKNIGDAFKDCFDF